MGLRHLRYFVAVGSLETRIALYPTVENSHPKGERVFGPKRR